MLTAYTICLLTLAPQCSTFAELVLSCFRDNSCYYTAHCGVELLYGFELI